ncbi:leucine-rich repeat-containing protein 15 [Chrysoperla carnea]|uniref:leucine-rich repeat-containing protein 15 n=1 Tax=Chrysoperla carnea TaxID=189513 RepID=UPI001D08E591|nr:leucine-rich repeat-containing protein 15 [Chrysoperla carnea]
MPSLQTLYLNNNQFLQIYSTMGIQHPFSTTINTIFINNCKLTVNYINNIVNLTQLHMSNNILINELIAITFQKNIHLEIIDLSKCSINHIDYLTFYPLTNLTELHLSDNRINYLHSETFLYNLKLSYLNLSRNHFKTLEPIQSISLKHLDLSYCELNIIERNTFKSLTALISLNLSNNYIEYLPDYLSINNLQYLDISYCRLLLITDYTFIEFNQLTKLKLNGNRFYQPFKETMLPDTLTSIALNDNPWRCDCYSLDLKYFYDYLNINDLTSESNLVCYSPTNLTGSTWNIACKKQWFRYNLINNFNHPNTNTIPHLERVWLFLIITFITLTVLFCVVSNARRLVTQRARREQVQMERLANEARERLRMIRDRQTMSLNNIAASTNAPDPRDLISPPSYEEALSMLRPSISDLRLKRPLSMLSTESTPNNMISMSNAHDQQSISVSSSASSLIVYQDNNPHDSRNNVQQSL